MLNLNKWGNKPTQRRPLLHVAHQVLHVLGDGLGVEEGGVHAALAVLEDHVHFLGSACATTHAHTHSDQERGADNDFDSVVLISDVPSLILVQTILFNSHRCV